MMSLDTTLTALLGIGGVAATFLVTRWYYKRSYEDLQRIKSELESLSVSQFRIVSAQNPNQDGELIKGTDGRWSVKWKRTLQESIALSDHLDMKVIKKSESAKE
ncbi:MAG: hypothetical protein WB643_03725 [Candidatus Bathyarchaeia archaeon]